MAPTIRLSSTWHARRAFKDLRIYGFSHYLNCVVSESPAFRTDNLRVADSVTWKSLGKSGDITKAQHCRAEFYDPRFGWIPVDPADVRKVVLEEEKDRLLPLDDPRVDLARKTLFGYWEMNWIAFNAAGDTRLAPQTAKPLGHFMYPYAETAKGPLDYYNPRNFQYRISAREVTA